MPEATLNTFMEFDAGGGLHDDEDATIVSAKFELETWQTKDGRASNAQPTIVCNLIRQFEDGTQDNYPLKLSVGSPDRWAPSADGMRLNRVKTDKPYNVHQDSGFGQFCQAVIKAGGSEMLKSASLADWQGHKYHWLNVALTDKEGKEMKDAKGYPKTRPTVSRYIGKGVATAPAGGTPVKHAAPAGSGDLDPLKGFLIGQLTDGPKDTKTLFLAANADKAMKQTYGPSKLMALINGQELYADGQLTKAGNQVSWAELPA